MTNRLNFSRKAAKGQRGKRSQIMTENEINWEVANAIFEYIEARRHEVKPRITGWAQMNGRNVSFICNFGFEMVI